MKNVWFQFISITYIVLDTFGILLSNCQAYDDWSDPQNLTLLEHFLRYHLGKIEIDTLHTTQHAHLHNVKINAYLL